MHDINLAVIESHDQREAASNLRTALLVRDDRAVSDALKAARAAQEAARPSDELTKLIQRAENRLDIAAL